MAFATVQSRATFGIQALPVTVEVHLSSGLPKFTMVGLPEKAVKESKDRVRSAILMSGFRFPGQKITVNLAPADLPKDSGRFDLAIAIGILLASSQIAPFDTTQFEFIGELALSGACYKVKQCLPCAIAAKKQNHILVLPKDNAQEAALIKSLKILPTVHLLELCQLLGAKEALPFYHAPDLVCQSQYPDLSEVKGQQQAKRALEIAACGGHSCLFSGPPGSGKTMLAKRLPSLLPALSLDEGYETAAILSMNKALNQKDWLKRPFRSPHHSASAPALVGGGNPPKPGEISLAHNGVLFLDELPEFQRHVLEMLREPLETGSIVISRAAHQFEFPARFQLIAAMNPCPCGYLGDAKMQCQCSESQIERYQQKLSGPFLDRIDLQISVTRMPLEDMSNIYNSESSSVVAKRVFNARSIQLDRQSKLNQALQTKELALYCDISPADQKYLYHLLNQFYCSARAYHRILKIARTIADLKQQSVISRADLTEAFQLRRGLAANHQIR